MNWTVLGSVAVCLPILLLHRASYNRLDVDMPVSAPDTGAVARSSSTDIITFHHQQTMSVDPDVSPGEPY